MDGQTLRDLLRDEQRLLPERALKITDGVLRALDYSHRQGIVHRDIRPGNVMLTSTGEVKVMDSGTVGALGDNDADPTDTPIVIGTAQYLSPEQARGERLDARSDLYSTGCLLYELLTGRPPFLGDSPVAIAYQHVREKPVPPSQLDPEIPLWADSIVLKAMAKDPAQRYQSAADMRTDIQRALSRMRPTRTATPDVTQTTVSTASRTTIGGRIFISYRHEETAYAAGWLFDRLAAHFGGGQVFKDVDSIDPGDDFVEVITTAVGSCDVLLALIGDRWATITDEAGRNRLYDPEDFVRLEIEAALTRNIRVIPILVEKARMPRSDQLPPSLAKLVRRQALELSSRRFTTDLTRLLKVLDKTLTEVGNPPEQLWE